jgi:phage/plasmid-like protein (TIGR03299 family)
MAAELDTSNNRTNMAFLGDRSKVWHGQGQQMEDNASIDEWTIAAGLNWNVETSDVSYTIPGSSPLFIPDVKTFPDRKVLYRSDTHAALSVVSKDFKVVQPTEVIEFFRDLVENNNMKLSTAGSLFGGRRFWALAELGKDFEVTSGDKVSGHLLLTTSVDSSIKTSARFVSTRVVCQNTLSIALAENSVRDIISISHRKQWDPTAVKINLGLLDKSWIEFMNSINKLVQVKITDKQSENFFQNLVLENKKPEPTRTELRKVEKLMELYKNGIGSDMSYGTAWGLLNAVTELNTHGTGRKGESHQFWDAEFGGQNEIKTKAYNMLMSEVS